MLNALPPLLPFPRLQLVSQTVMYRVALIKDTISTIITDSWMIVWVNISTAKSAYGFNSSI